MQESYQEAIDDCTKGQYSVLVGFTCIYHVLVCAVLELEPRYLKAVMRRAQALEALQKYEDALEGTRG